MIAVKRLQSLFWVLLVALGVLGAYLVSLRVATERNELMRVRAQIAAARADIRYLETEFSARASMRQLEKWNAEDFRYSALSADHYLDGERALAHLDGAQPNGPAYVAQPVLVAMAEAENGKEAVPAIEPVASPAVLQIRSDVATIRAASVEDQKNKRTVVTPGRTFLASVKSDSVTTASRPARIDRSPQPGSLAQKTERMALLDARLLDDRTLGDIGRKAAAEIRGGLR